MKARNLVLLSLIVVGVTCISRMDPPRQFGREESALINPAGIGLNLGSLDFPPEQCDDPATCIPIRDALDAAVTLRTRWIRLEISQGRDAGYWDGVIARFQDAGISVLGQFNNTLWDGGSRDPDVCDSYYATDFGTALATDWLDRATSYLEVLRGRVGNWEIWNEANNIAADGGTNLCPANYAFLLTEAAIRWREIRQWDVTIGPSMLTFGSATDAGDYLTSYLTSDYLNHLFNNTDKVAFYRPGHGDNPPWVRVYDHAYPCHDDWCGARDETPSTYLTNQANAIRAVQPAPIWFTELGFQATDNQANNLLASYDVALNRGLAEKVFWYKLTDCGPHGPYGLVNGCEFTSDPRDSFWKFQSLSTNSLDCHSMTACKMTRPGTGCETPSFECPAIRFDLGWPQTLHAHSNGYDAPQCGGSVSYVVDGDVNFPVGGTWIIYTQLNFCPAAQYSANYTVGPCSTVCGNYQCQNPLPDCDVFGAELAPAMKMESN